MLRLWLVHWNAAEGKTRADTLRAAGYGVTFLPIDANTLRRLKSDAPAAVVIDLSRAPGQGRDIGLSIRHARATRYVPIVFVDGDAAAVSRVKQHLPDASYATWRTIRGAVKRAIAQPPASPVVPASLLAGYSGTPLPKKLGVAQGSLVALLGAPKGFEQTIAPLPPGVTVTRRPNGTASVTLWFVRSCRELEDEVGRMIDFAKNGGLWIVWPKKTSALASDLTQAEVRRAGLAAGLVDFKVAAIDATWAGLRFTIRKRGKERT